MKLPLNHWNWLTKVLPLNSANNQLSFCFQGIGTVQLEPRTKDAVSPYLIFPTKVGLNSSKGVLR
jgi:hypothetical protein